MSFAKKITLAALALPFLAPGASAQAPKPAPKHSIEVQLSIVECTFPGDTDPLSTHWPACEEIDKLPSKAKKLLDRLTITGASGENLAVNHIKNPAPDHKEDPMAFARGESGTKVEIKPEEYDLAFAVDIAFQFRQQGDDQDGKIVTDIDFNNSFEAWNDFPVVIHISSVPNRPGRFICVIARVRRMNADGKPADDAVSSSKK